MRVCLRVVEADLKTDLIGGGGAKKNLKLIYLHTYKYERSQPAETLPCPVRIIIITDLRCPNKNSSNVSFLPSVLKRSRSEHFYLKTSINEGQFEM